MSTGSSFTTPFQPDGFDSVCGLVIDVLEDELAVGHFEVRDELRQPAGILHGGVLASVAESLASVGTFAAVVSSGSVAMGLSNQTSFLRPIVSGTVTARAVRRHAGRTTWVWEVEFTDSAGRLCALTRMTVAVRPAGPEAGSGAAGSGDAGG